MDDHRGGPHPDDVRVGLRQAVTARRDAQLAEQAALIDMADWCIRASHADGITMGEVADIVGMSRSAVYDLVAWRQGRQATRS